MFYLFQSDFWRMLSRKSYLTIFLSIPFMVYLMGIQGLKANQVLPMDKQTTWETFALYTPMHKIFSIYLFSVVVIFVISTFAGEYETGEIRMVLIRGYHSYQVIFIKYLNTCLSLGCFIMTYLGMSYMIGFLLFPRELNISTFLSSETLHSTQILVLTLKYYGILFLILNVFSLIIFLVCILTRSVVTATALSMAIILASLGLYLVTQLITPYFSGVNVQVLNQFSLVLMQLKGIYLILAGDSELLLLATKILISYFILFGCLNLSISYHQDQLI